MFNVKDFFKTPYNIETVTTSINNHDFLIRRLNGLERLAYNDMKSMGERAIYILANCLIDGTTKDSIGEEFATQLIKYYDALANAIIDAILDLTAKSLEEESAVWKEAEKNLQSTSIKSSTDNIVIGTN